MRALPAFLLALALVSTSAEPGAQPQVQTVPGGPGQQSPSPPGQGAQTRPPRDPGQKPSPAAGTGVIRGRVVSADNGQPIRRARVAAFMVESRTEIRENRGTLTDEQGQFELKELTAGRYTLTAMKTGFVALSYGQRRPVETPRPLVMADGQLLEKIDFHLPRGGVVTGRVLDEFGEPISEVMVQVLRFRYLGGQRRLLNAGRSNQTDDLGQFRLYGLPPGEYYVSAGLIPGMSLNITGISVGYATTYYPGTPSLSEAQRITIGVGQETSNIVFSLSPARTARITGRVLSSDGNPAAGVFLSVRQESPDGMMFGGGGARTRPDGTFELSGITPGDYSIDVQPRFGNEPEMASAMVTVSGQDISGLTLVMSKGGAVRGQIVFEDGKAPQSLRPSAVQLFASTTSFGPQNLPGRGSVKDDWSFEITGLNGQRLIRALLPPGWNLKSVIYDGSDVTDRPIDFGTNAEFAGIQIVLTQRQTDLSGTVVDLRGNLLKDYVVVVFAEDSAHWVPQTRFIRTSRPDQDGRFSIRGLPPERYLAVAVEYLEPGEESNPDTLEQLKPMATGLLLTEGEARVAELKLSAF
jgi:hypothetical protein